MKKGAPFQSAFVSSSRTSTATIEKPIVDALGIQAKTVRRIVRLLAFENETHEHRALLLGCAATLGAADIDAQASSGRFFW